MCGPTEIEDSAAMRGVRALLLSGSLAAGCLAPESELGPGASPGLGAHGPLTAPAPADVFEAGTGGGLMQGILLVRVLDEADAPAPDVVVWADGAHGRVEGRTDAEGRALLTGVEGPCDVHVFGEALYRTLLGVESAALTVRLGDGAPRPPPRQTVETQVRGLDQLPDDAPVRFAHVRHFSWPGAGALRPGLPISEDVAVRAEGLDGDLSRVRVPVPDGAGGALLTLFGRAEQARLTSWGREIGWDAVSHVTLTRLPGDGARAVEAVPLGAPLSERLEVVFGDVRRHATRLAASRWEARYEIVHPELGATRALLAGASAAFNEFELSLRVPAATDGFEDVRFLVTVRAYQGDWWVAERTLEARRGEPLFVEGFPTGRPGRSRDGRDLEIGLPPDAGFARLIFQAGAPRWWVDVLDRRRRATLPAPPPGREDPLARDESPLMRAHFFERLDPAAWSADTADRAGYLGVSIER